MSNETEGKFAFLYDLSFDRVLRKTRQNTIKIVKENKVQNIIDLGCGTGAQCSLMYKTVPNIHGVDLSAKMLSVAKKKIPEEINLHKEDISKTSFKEQQFDAALISFVLHPNDHENIKKIIKESYRITKKEGIIIITDYDNGTQTKGKIAQKIIKIIETLAQKTHRTNYYSFMNHGGLEKILKTEGHDIINTYDFYNGAIKTIVIRSK